MLVPGRPAARGEPWGAALSDRDDRALVIGDCLLAFVPRKGLSKAFFESYLWLISKLPLDFG